MPNHKDTSAVYINKYGMENRITSFRCSISLRDRLFDYAQMVNREPSSIIREAIAEYLRNRNVTPSVNMNNDLNGWSAKSTKI
jgi:molybdate-binding protein